MTSRTDVPIRRRRTSKQRQQLLDRFHQSQLTQEAFAARHGIGVSTLGKWLQCESRKTLPPVKFHEVALPRATHGWSVEVVSPKGWIVRLHDGSELQTLPQLLRALPC
jgi:transposase-like protein